MKSSRPHQLMILLILTTSQFVLPVLAQSDGSRKPRRVALVIGNSNYKVGRLDNPKNDAQDLAVALRQVGFEVTLKLDRNKFEIEQDIDAVTDNLVKGDAVMFFYAGHGLQVKNSNYLVPIKAEVSREHHVQQRCVDIDYLLAAIEGSGASMRIVVLDACRHNPFRSFSRNSRQGLAAVAAPEGTIVAYSTAPGQVAEDGEGKNSPFAKHLVKVLKSNPRQGLEVSQLFTIVARAVKKETGQRAFLTTDASMDSFFLKPAVKIGYIEKSRSAQPARTPLDSYAGLEIDQVRKYAENNILAAQYEMGERYYFGRSVSRSHEQAVTWYHKAAELGHSNSQFNLGFMYKEGRGVDQSYEEALRWYRKAAEQGDQNAQVNVAFAYAKGQGVEQSYEEACKWYREAAEQGNEEGQANLGVLYSKGQGVEKSYEEAVKWFRKAAEQEYAVGQFNLGVMYEKGRGVDQSNDEALKWYRKAAEQGNARGQAQLGFMYENGEGVEEDRDEAIRLYRLAAQQNSQYAKDQLRRLGVE